MPSSNKINTVAVFFITALAFIAASAIYQRLRSRRIAGGRRCCSDSNEKPQNRFKRVLADNSYSPFKHYKHDGKEKEISLKVHPYEEEIASLLERPPNQVEFIIGHESLTMDHPYVWIHTKDQLEFLARLLGEEHAFAVDTEQHSLRSFLGFTALMQISTQKEDFLLDTIALHDAMGILRPVFADPSICKVFHGADNDVLWLQRDFHIYVVNMFDTAKACEVLSKPQKSLAYLLGTYCGVSTDKTFQREDWRLRPLSAEMIQYARTDAHYLLYIADCLASELRKDNSACFDEKFNLLFEATRRSNMVCMQLYAKETDSSPGASAAASLYSRNLHVQEFTPSKISEIKEHLWKLCAWRDLMIVKTYFGGREITAEDLEMALLVGMSPHEIRRLEKKKGLRLKRNNKNSFQIPAQTNEYDINLSSDVHNSKELSEDGDANDIDNEQEVLSFKGAKKLSLLGHGPHGKQVVEHLLSNYEEDGVSQFCQKWRQVFVEAVRPRFLPPGWDIMHSGRREFGDYSVYNPAKRAIEMTIN